MVSSSAFLMVETAKFFLQKIFQQKNLDAG